MEAEIEASSPRTLLEGKVDQPLAGFEGKEVAEVTPGAAEQCPLAAPRADLHQGL